MWQQIIVYVCVAAAALYLGRYIVDGVRSIVNARSGCGEGCAKCAFAEPAQKRSGGTAGSPAGSVIPLSDIRTLPGRKE